MDDDLVKSAIEAIIFAASEPVSLQSLVMALQPEPTEKIQKCLDQLENYYSARRRGFQLTKVAGGYQFRTLPELAQWILKSRNERPSKLSRAALETLSIIVYNHPITRHKVEQIRGVESSGTIRSLMDKELVLSMGRQDIPGRPILYGPTKKFLEVFGLKDFSELPELPEAEQIEGILDGRDPSGKSSEQSATMGASGTTPPEYTG